MKWEGQEQSDNVEDRRGMGGGGRGGLPIGGRGIGVGTIVIALVAGWIFGINPLTVLGILSGGGGAPTAQVSTGPAPAPPADDAQARFVSVVLRSTEDVWTEVFRSGQAQYVRPKLVLFRGATATACGTGQSAMGPFYCPGDQQVYIDLQFFDTLHQRLGAPGDFAQAYVIAHEVGHHVQQLLGISEKVEAARRGGSEAQANAMSVRLELQADCFAGVWANRSQQARQWLEQGDVDEALNAASQIGDDTLQRRSQGQIVPESFTHGSSAQRVSWFKRGMQTGRIADCNTFEASRL
ncbi:metalloprotease [Methylibium sp. Pch-M]|uniref:KPN_02809 family neutral zinc metallopeptidase n=1 Tax=Methylibium sp. Pch-M TaxID=2082386 RepID=UPI0010106223|nr:neutral zinc metallopeptidase [Methylibium sp. Pch-M]QAZ38333.1 metalloprotease [Methylibium sp. Pch-M]